ncbi:MAG: PilZ domain-containing protein [Bdellovibrionales bacterium]|nr:PilZ domain-containing protein [Bdellovibrionales bacterium]
MDREQHQSPAPRLPLEMNIEFRRSYARQSDTGKLKNISLTGAFLETEHTPELYPEDKVILTFEVSGRKRKMNARIIWKNGKGCGVSFIPFNNRDVQIVDDLMYFAENKRKTTRSVLDDIFRKVG